MPENTAARDPMLHLLGALSEGSSGYIENMERDGQRQLVASQDLPTRINGGSAADFEAVGFIFGEPNPNDPLFRPATLPQGWSREGSDHAMWSYLLDEHGRRRVSIFFKAAFYDRDAFMSLCTPGRYLVEVLGRGGVPVLDDGWLTAERAVAELERIRDRYLGEAEEAYGFAASGQGDYWRERAAEHRRSAAVAEAMCARIGEAVSTS